MTLDDRIKAAIEATDKALAILMDAPQLAFVQLSIIELRENRDLLEGMLQPEPSTDDGNYSDVEQFGRFGDVQ